MDRFLEGRRILIVEDDYLAAIDMKYTVENLGGLVVGPVGQKEAARDLWLAEHPDGAVLDIRLDHTTTYSLARDLLAAGVAVVFLTGFEARSIDPEFREVPRIAKPYDPIRGARVLREMFGHS